MTDSKTTARSITYAVRQFSAGMVDQSRQAMQHLGALRRDLRPVFFPGASEDLPSAPAVRSDEELRKAVQDLFADGAANDQVIRSAFTVTSGGARFSAINTPQFWPAMKQAEALAARISNSQ